MRKSDFSLRKYDFPARIFRSDAVKRKKEENTYKSHQSNKSQLPQIWSSQIRESSREFTRTAALLALPAWRGVAKGLKSSCEFAASRLSENSVRVIFSPQSTRRSLHLPWRAVPGRKCLKLRVLRALRGLNWLCAP